MKTLFAAIAIAFTLSLGAADKLGGASKLGGDDKVSVSVVFSGFNVNEFGADFFFTQTTDTKIAKGMGSTKKASEKFTVSVSYETTMLERYKTPIDQTACKAFLEEKIKQGIAGVDSDRKIITLKDGSSLNAALIAWVRTQMELAKSAPKPPKEQAK